MPDKESYQDGDGRDRTLIDRKGDPAESKDTNRPAENQSRTRARPRLSPAPAMAANHTADTPTAAPADATDATHIEATAEPPDNNDAKPPDQSHDGGTDRPASPTEYAFHFLANCRS